jgi:hypothetical protein
VGPVFGACDESGIHAEARWWVIGAMWLPDDGQLPPYNCWGEFKWQKLHPAFAGAYQDFLNVTLGLPDLRFTSIVIDTKLLTPAEMRMYHDTGGKKEAYVKFTRMLLRQRIGEFVDAGTGTSHSSTTSSRRSHRSSRRTSATS